MVDIRTILGSMTFASQTGKAEAIEMLDKFIQIGVEVDTARMYNHGLTENLLGELLNERPEFQKLRIATKANPFSTHDKSLTAESVHRQLDQSLNALGKKCVDIFYLHAPDQETPIMETLHAVNEAYKNGKFQEFGLSNYQAWEVAFIHAKCRENNFPLPTVYQGMYNAITREVERELFPCLRAHNIRFYAYNPLCGGALTGKLDRSKLDSLQDGSRFDLSNKMYRDRYLQKVQLDAIDLFVQACSNQNISPTSAALRWLKFHSKLSNSDGIIIGASKMSHLSDNLLVLHQEYDSPLPDSILSACDSAWILIQQAGSCPSYERGHSLIE